MLIKPSVALESKIKKILESGEPAVFKPEATMYNPDTEYKYVIRAVKSFSLSQAFYSSYMDQMHMFVQVTPAEYKSLRENLTNLQCTLILYYVDDNQNINYDYDPVIIDAKAIIPSMEDVDKGVGANFIEDENSEQDSTDKQHQHELLATLEIQLIEPDCYECRHVQLNSMFTSTEIEPVLHWSAAMFGAESTAIVSPNNTLSYTNLVIPPMKDISTLLPYLQQRYGIYSKGLGYYFTNKTFYIYPQYSTDFKDAPVKNVLHVVSAPEAMYQGDVNHLHEEDDISVITNKLTVSTANTKASENSGTVAMSIRADSMRDQEVTVDTKGKVKRNSSDMVAIKMQNKGGTVSANMQHTKYTAPSSNIFNTTSEMAKNDGTYATFTWLSAIPKELKPGQHLVLHMDSNGGVYKTQEGTVLSVTYSSAQIPGTLTETSLRFSAVIVAKLSSDYSSDEEYQTQ